MDTCSRSATTGSDTRTVEVYIDRLDVKDSILDWRAVGPVTGISASRVSANPRHYIMTLHS